MLYVLNDGTVKLTRGDTARLSVSIVSENENGEASAYEMAAGDVLTLTIKKSADVEQNLLQKQSVGSASFYLEPIDTKGLPYGKYKYDVQLQTAQGEIYTIIEPSTFEITKEVTW